LGALGYVNYLIYNKKFRQVPCSKYENFWKLVDRILIQ
jgi:hypothetical protein